VTPGFPHQDDGLARLVSSIKLSRKTTQAPILCLSRRNCVLLASIVNRVASTIKRYYSALSCDEMGKPGIRNQHRRRACIRPASVWFSCSSISHCNAENITITDFGHTPLNCCWMRAYWALGCQRAVLSLMRMGVGAGEPPDSVAAMSGDRIGMSNTHRFTAASYDSLPASRRASPRFVIVSVYAAAIDNCKVSPKRRYCRIDPGRLRRLGTRH
jgi:hypothetical protein